MKRPQPSLPLSPARKRLFTAFMLSLPLLVLSGTETVLRLVGYGGNLDLVVQRQLGDRQYYTLNRHVASRYFTSMAPDAIEDDAFEVDKQPNTMRIFCLGESTMAGFPYEYSATPSGFLRDRLQASLPQYRIEVINVGMSAVSSYVILDFMKELLRYQPDLFIVYSGHNEFYGAYGAGSTIAIGGSPVFTDVAIALTTFRTFLAARDAYTWLLGLFAPSPQQLPSLMGAMVANQHIRYGSEAYLKARQAYERNIRAMVDISRDHGVPIIFSALVSNLRSHAPFHGVFSENTTEDRQREIASLLREGDSLKAIGHIDAARESFRQAYTTDSGYASSAFKLAWSLLDEDRIGEALHLFRRARDLDALRFRASGDFESLLRSICNELKVPVAPVDSVFAAASPLGIPGSELLLEHLHPNIRGYFLMARTFATTLASTGVLAPTDQWQTAPDDSTLMDTSTVAEFDHTVGKVRVELLMRKWPFHTGPVNYEFTAATPIEGVAFRYLQKTIAWSEARYLVAEWHARNKDFELARRECLAVAKVLFYSYQPLLRVADYYRMEGRNDEAKRAYASCFATEDNPFARFKLAIILLEENRNAEASAQIAEAFSVDATGRHKLPLPAAASGRYLQGVAYARLGRMQDARLSLERALALDPNLTDARELLQRIQTHHPR